MRLLCELKETNKELEFLAAQAGAEYEALKKEVWVLKQNRFKVMKFSNSPHLWANN